MSVVVRVIELIVIVLMGVIATVVIAEVGLRSLFDSSLIVTDELSRGLMVWMAMLAVAVLVYEDGHIRTTILPDMLPPFRAGVMLAVSDVIVMFYLAVVVVASLSTGLLRPRGDAPWSVRPDLLLMRAPPPTRRCARTVQRSVAPGRGSSAHAEMRRRSRWRRSV